MRPTIYDVARLAGVSSTMASRILRGSRKRHDALTEHVKAAAVATGYQPNRAAASLRTTESGLIGLVVPELRNPFFSAYAESLSRRALDNDYVVMSLVADGTDVLPVVQRLVEYRVRAIVSAVPAVIESIQHVGYDGLVIAVTRQPKQSIIPYIGMDDFTAGQLVGEHLIKFGHHSIVIFAESLEIPSTSPRLDGIAKVTPKTSSIITQYIDRVDEVTVNKVQVAYQDTLPTAFVAGSDAIALRLYSAVGQLGLRIPADISLISFDGTFAVEDLVPLPLTTVVQPIDQCTQKVMDWINHGLAHSALAQPHFIPPQFKQGLTTQNLIQNTTRRTDKS